MIDFLFWDFSFLSEYRFDVSKLEPLVAKVSLSSRKLFFWLLLESFSFVTFKVEITLCNVRYAHLQPHSPDNRALARECRDVKIDRVYIGSCTGGKTEDFLAAARVFQASVSAIYDCHIWISLWICWCYRDKLLATKRTKNNWHHNLQIKFVSQTVMSRPTNT